MKLQLMKIWSELWQTAIVYLPRVVGALVLLALGWLISRLLRALTLRLGRRVARWGRVHSGAESEAVEAVALRAIATIVFWAVLLLFVAAAGQVLGLPAVTFGLSRLAVYLPSLLTAVVIIAAGVVGGNLARATTSSAARAGRIPQGELLAQVVRGAILMLAAVIAIQQVGIDGTVLVVAVGLVLGGFVGGAAIAFGLGAKSSVGNLIALSYIRQTYRPGQMVQLGDLRGRIVAFQRGGVAVQTESGLALVPARLFEEQISVQLDPEHDRERDGGS